MKIKLTNKNFGLPVLVLALLTSLPLFGRNGVDIQFDRVSILKNSAYLPLELTISNFSGSSIREIQVLYKYSDDSHFRARSMNNEGFRYYANLRLDQSETGMVEYYFIIRYMDGGEEPFPGGAPLSNIYRTAVQQMRNYGDDIVIVNPDPETRVSANDVVITASFARFSTMVDVEKSKMYLDTWDVSKYLAKFSDFVTFAPKKVPLGQHKIRLELYDSNSDLIASREWSFTATPPRVTQASESAFNLSGSFFAEARRENLRSGLSVADYNQGALQFQGNYSSLRFGGRAYLSNQEQIGRQHVNRFSGFVRFDFWNHRFIRLNAGDAYPDFSPLILQNILVRGGLASLNLKFMNLDFAYGETLRPVEGYGRTETDTASGNNRVVVERGGTFKRDILAIRPSFGAGDNFRLGLTFLKGADDTSSIIYGTDPKENAAAGADLFLGMDQQRIVLQGNFNVSAYNRNIRGGTMAFDSLSSVIEDISAGEKNYYNFVKNFITANQFLNLRPGLAYRVNIQVRYFRNNLNLTYESVDEGYYSLGQPYLLRDNRGFNISDNMTLLKNQVFLNLGYRQYHDNLQNLKTTTTTNRNIYVNISYFPLGNFPELSLAYNNYNRENDLPTDSIGSILYRPENNQTNSISFSTGYRFNFLKYKNRAGLNLTSYRRTDIYNYSESSSDYMALNVRTEYNIPLQTIIEFVLQQSETGTATPRGSSLDLTSFGGGIQYAFKNILTTDQLSIRAYAQVGKLTSIYKIASSSLNYNRNYFNLRANYSIPSLGSIGLAADILSFSGDRNYQDYIYSARYEYNF
ncbi:MAG: hypothetical protein P8184_05290 [Calditrichia bacterium]